MEDREKENLLTETLERVKKLEEAIQQIHKKVEQLETKQLPQRGPSNQLKPETIQEIDLMNLPDNLRRTMMSLAKLKEATPEEVAEKTNRTRGLENLYLNQLEMLNYVEKIKRGKRVYYRSLRTM